MKVLFSLETLFIFSLFPWTTFNILNIPLSEISILPLIFLIGYILFNNIEIDTRIIFIIFFFTIGIFISLIIGSDFQIILVLRSFYNYFMFLILLIILFQEKKKVLKTLPRIIYIVNIIWIIFACIQFLEIYNYNFASRWSGSFSFDENITGRGVYSFAPEPSYFAFFLIISTWIILLKNNFKIKNFKKNEIFLIFFNFLSIVFLCRSTLGVIITFLFISIFSLEIFIRYTYNSKNKFFIFIISFFTIYAFLFLYIFFIDQINFDNNRALKFLNNVLDDKNYLFYAFQYDESISTRIENILFPITGFFHNYTLPGGLSGYNLMREDLTLYYNNVFSCSYPDCELFLGKKIMSLFGDIIFQLGIFGIIGIFLLFKLCMNTKVNYISSNFVMLLIIFFMAIPISYILIPYLITMISNYGKK